MSTVKEKKRALSPILKKALDTIPSKELEELITTAYPELTIDVEKEQILAMLDELEKSRAGLPVVSVVDLIAEGRREREITLGIK